MYETLYRKYRPQIFKDLCGNENIFTAIKNSIIFNKLSHAYIFSGPRGLGKTTIARLIAKSLNCKATIDKYEPCNRCENCISILRNSFPDLIEIDAASNRGIDEIREIKEAINYKPLIGSRKIYIIDEVHMLTKEAFNALLKTLEEPPKHIIFILATTEIEKIPETIQSRCQRYNFSLLDENNIVKRLKFISSEENINIDQESLYLIARETGGSVRDSITLLEKISSCYPDELIDIKKIEEALGLVESTLLKKFLLLIKNKNSKEALDFIKDLWIKGVNLESFFRQYSYYLNESNEKVDFVLGSVDTIFSALAQFRSEDNKKVVSYIIVKRLINNLEFNRPIKETKNIKGIEKDLKFVDKIIEVFNKESIKNVTLEDVKLSWDKICENLKDKKMSLMIFCKESIPHKLEGKNLEIGFKKDFSYHKETLEKSENLIILENSIREVLNFSLTIKPIFLEEGSN